MDIKRRSLLKALMGIPLLGFFRLSGAKTEEIIIKTVTGDIGPSPPIDLGNVINFDLPVKEDAFCKFKLKDKFKDKYFGTFKVDAEEGPIELVENLPHGKMDEAKEGRTVTFDRNKDELDIAPHKINHARVWVEGKEISQDKITIDPKRGIVTVDKSVRLDMKLTRVRMY